MLVHSILKLSTPTLPSSSEYLWYKRILEVLKKKKWNWWFIAKMSEDLKWQNALWEAYAASHLDPDVASRPMERR